MYRLFMIAKNNVKKQKGDMFTFFIMTFLSALLIFDCASAIQGIGKVMEDRFHEINGAHVMIINQATEAETESAEKAFQEDSHVVDYERTPLVRFTTEYRKKGDQDFSTFSFIADSILQEKRIMSVEVPDREYQKMDILLPYNLSRAFSKGDVMQIKFGDDIYDFQVAGYLEDPYFCSTINLTVYYVGISPEMMEELSENYPFLVLKGYLHKGIMDETMITKNYGTMQLEQEIANRYKDYLSEYSAKDPNANYMNFMAVNWQMMRGGSMFIPQIVTSIILAFAVLILIIALVIISFSIKNFIQRNMKNTGILEASGYTVKELRAALVFQLLLVATLGLLAGIGVAIATFGMFGNVVSAVLGLHWNQPVNALAAIMTPVLMLLVIGLVGLWISSAYKKISVLDALRGGIGAHNFKKNYFAFDKTPLPVSLVLALKDTFGGLGRNLLMVFVSTILVISTLIGFGMVENFAKDANSLMKLMAFELCTDEVTVDQGTEDISDDLRALPGVENVLVNLGFEPTVRKGDQESTVYVYAADDVKYALSINLLEGRLPEKENEILVTLGVANDLGLKVGDVVEMELSGKKADYLVTGINQRVERMGRSIIMLISGAEEIFPGDVISGYQYFVTAKEGVTYENVKAQIEAYAETKGITVQNNDVRAAMDSTIASVVSALNAICVVIAVLTIIVVIFVESLVIRAKIAKEWRGMGISKALGQTSGGLITQIMLSNIPAILTGAILGGLLSPLAGGSMVKAAFSLFAVKKVDFQIPAYCVLFTIAGIVIVAILTSAAAGLKVRKLKPVTMITEE